MDLINAEEMKEFTERAQRIRQHIVKMTNLAGSGHPGGSLSAIEILTCLYFKIMRHNPKDPSWAERDRFILSKGHAAPGLYAVLAEAGYFPVEELWTLRKLGCRLQGHPSMTCTPGVEMSTGSLGHGLAVANGMAMAAKLDRKLHRIFVLCGDGEMDVGEIWESAMLASHYKLDNIIMYLDRNMLQLDGPTEKIMSLEPLADKWKAFGWNVQEIDGHDMREIILATDHARQFHGKPSVIICHTVKGKGVSFMEGCLQFHGKAPNKDECAKALEELRVCHQ